MGEKQTGDVVRQRTWTEEELQAAGFAYYSRRKELVLARELPAAEAPKQVKTAWDTLVAEAGSMLIYRPDSPEARASLDDYDHWPVDKAIFEQSYAPWDDALPETPAVRQLLAAGCRPYYKRAGCWARRLTAPTAVQSLESPEPVVHPSGAWLCIGVEGEPWVVSDAGFRARYEVGRRFPRLIQRLLGWLPGLSGASHT
ncbi:MAG: hypothetical protein Kow0077_08820 [Anaerolineae bacterium]